MKIVHFSHCNLGSAEASTAHVMEFADRLQSRGHQVTVMTPAKGTCRRPTNCRMIYFPYVNCKGLRQPTALICAFFTLLFLYRKERFDCLYVRRLALDCIPGIISWLTKVPLIVETNGQIEINEFEVPFHLLWKPFWYPLLRAFEWILFTPAFAVTADGARRLENFVARYPQFADKFHLVLSGGIDLERFRRVDKKEARENLRLADGRRYLIWVGTIFAWSGLEVLIEAAPGICGEFADVDILIVGEGPQRGVFMDMVAQKRLAGRVIFTGYIATADLYLWLSAADIALAPYTRLRLDREDFTSYKIFEYLACGLPVVTSYEKGDSNISYVAKYGLGAAVPPEDPRAFGQAVSSVLRDASFFSPDFPERTRAVLKKMEVTWDAVVDKVERLCLATVKS